MTEELPNLSLLIKLLKLTTSQSDAEALSAIRKANEQLSKFGGDWESLLRRHITIIGADPFASIPTPPQATQQPAYTAPATHTVAPKPAPPRQHQTQAPLLRANTYAGYCHSCGVHVKEHAGFIKMPLLLSRWLVFCNHCHTHNVSIQAKPARKRTSTAPKPSLDDIIGKL